MTNILLKIAYDGSRFHGWQKQQGSRTVQGVLEKTLEGLCRAPVQLEGASRTDAKVHALCQYATMRGQYGIPAEKIPVAANNLLSDVMIVSSEIKQEDFHARFSAAGKTYLYRFAIAPAVTVFLNDYVCILANRPNIVNMVEAARYIEGTQDFACFQSAGGTPRETTVRTVFSIGVSERIRTDSAGNQYEAVEIEVTGDGFLYNMARIISGTLAEAGFGRITAKDIKDIIASKDRSRAGYTAPPQGLYLKKVYFNGEDIIKGAGD
jgi:tRNA pseudouridine38-40 synthase